MIKYNIIDNRTKEVIHEVYANTKLKENEVYELAIDCGHDASDRKFWRIDNVT